MGMYDDVEFEMSCPSCGEKVSGFQSKDGPCLLLKVNVSQIRNFYTSCSKCSTWIDCVYIPPTGVGTIVASYQKEGVRREEKILWDSSAEKELEHSS